MAPKKRSRGQAAAAAAAAAAAPAGPPAVDLKREEEATLKRSLSERIPKDSDLQHPVAFQVKELIQEYRRFMWIKSRTDTPVSPSKIIDGLWHLHILDTRRYADFCERNFGRFIHHTPFSPPTPIPKQLFDESEQHFGPISKDCWLDLKEESEEDIEDYGDYADCG